MFAAGRQDFPAYLRTQHEMLHVQAYRKNPSANDDRTPHHSRAFVATHSSIPSVSASSVSPSTLGASPASHVGPGTHKLQVPEDEVVERLRAAARAAAASNAGAFLFQTLRQDDCDIFVHHLQKSTPVFAHLVQPVSFPSRGGPSPDHAFNGASSHSDLPSSLSAISASSVSASAASTPPASVSTLTAIRAFALNDVWCKLQLTALFEALHLHCPEISSISLRTIRCDPKVWAAMAAWICRSGGVEQSSPLRSIVLRDAELLSSDLAVLCDAMLASCPLLCDLDLTANRLRSVHCIADALTSSPSQSGVVSFDHEPDSVALCPWTRLSLANNPLADAGITVLAKALACNMTVTELDLSRTSIGRRGARALAELLAAAGGHVASNISALRRLVLNDNRCFQDDGPATARGALRRWIPQADRTVTGKRKAHDQHRRALANGKALKVPSTSPSKSLLTGQVQSGAAGGDLETDSEMRPHPAQMSVSDLKQALHAAGQSTTGILEKSELVRAFLDHVAASKTNARSSAAHTRDVHGCSDKSSSKMVHTAKSKDRSSDAGGPDRDSSVSDERDQSDGDEGHFNDDDQEV
jgi:hypothetical protein